MSQVIQKFLAQEDTHRNLQGLVEEGQTRIELLQRERQSLKKQLEELKFSSGGAGVGTRRVLEEFEQHLVDSKARCDRNRKKYERTTKILIDVKAGVEHIADKLEVVTLDSDTFSSGDHGISDVLSIVCILSSSVLH